MARTVNPLIHITLENFFSGKQAGKIYEDPEDGTKRFGWSFDDINIESSAGKN